MALSRDIYQAFEDVVGAENISDDPAIMPAYHSNNFAAVVLPGNRDEIQMLVKLCNKYRLQFASASTDWTGLFPDDIIYLDLRRMNRIIEINEKNMYAVVEPYVVTGELHAELMKRGLICNIKGSGANCSAMLRGHGHLDQTTSGDDRNQLAIEWVTPEGDLVRLGSTGSTDQWFCGDGPGPSLRSLISSAVPPGVTPGVFTRAALKLYHWPGPPGFPLTGISPHYSLSGMPANMMARYYSFPSVEKMWQAEIKIGENEIAFELMGFNAAMVAANITASNEEEAQFFKKINREVKGPGFFIIVAGSSREDFEFKKKVLAKIINDNDGKSLSAVEDPETEGILLCQCVRISASIRETFRPGGAFNSIPVMGQRDLTIRWAVGAGEAKKPLIEKGYIVDDGGAFFGWGVEQGHLGKTEIFCKYDPTNAEAKEAVLTWQKEQMDRAFRENYFAVTMGASLDTTDEIGTALSNYHLWWKKIKEAIDPNEVAAKVGINA
ncbi:MAG: FAD-binding oxidoreductase [Dehalococcoidales bacterium]|nr:FAD-binding oxidoreductase [Dehalococcoidales bacterium]